MVQGNGSRLIQRISRPGTRSVPHVRDRARPEGADRGPGARKVRACRPRLGRGSRVAVCILSPGAVVVLLACSQPTHDVCCTTWRLHSAHGLLIQLQSAHQEFGGVQDMLHGLVCMASPLGELWTKHQDDETAEIFRAGSL